MLSQLLALLTDGQWHDGNALGAALKQTRSNIWKQINKLRNEGVEIASHKRKGYRLLQPFIPLEVAKIKEKLVFDCPLFLFDVIESTNDFLKANASPVEHAKIQIALAEKQTKGRGRLGRQWHSPFGKNIYFSLAFLFEKDVSRLAGLSLVVGLAVRKAILSIGLGGEFLPEALKLKWPNDLLYDGKKIAGILIDMQAECNHRAHVIIGIGINVNMAVEANPSITQPFTSLKEITSIDIDRNRLSAQLIHYLYDDLALFEQMGFAAFLKAWHTVDYLQGQTITMKQGHQCLQGVVLGVNHEGYLLLRTDNGMIETCSSGEASILKAK